jgi:hypothetical protein
MLTRAHLALVLSVAALHWVAPSLADAAKGEARYDSDETYIAMSGPVTVPDGATFRVQVGLLAPSVLAGLDQASAVTCSATMDLLILDANDPSGTPLAQRAGVPIRFDTALQDYVQDFGVARSLYAVIVGKSMKTTGCVVRASQQVIGADGAIQVDTQIYRQDFGQVQATKKN